MLHACNFWKVDNFHQSELSHSSTLLSHVSHQFKNDQIFIVSLCITKRKIGKISRVYDQFLKVSLSRSTSCTSFDYFFTNLTMKSTFVSDSTFVSVSMSIRNLVIDQIVIWFWDIYTVLVKIVRAHTDKREFTKQKIENIDWIIQFSMLQQFASITVILRIVCAFSSSLETLRKRARYSARTGRRQ